MKFANITPILRIFDEVKAREFYVDYLGFTIDWEHRFEEELPLYMSVSRDACRIHLSEHHGDATPGASVRIEADDVRAYHRELQEKAYRFARPGVDPKPWNSLEMTITDPFGNRLTFFETTD